MMDGVVRLLLTIGLILASMAAFTASLRVILGYISGSEWHWGGVLAAYAGPFAFAAALHLVDRRVRRADA